jgi:hypothetical protein
VKMRTGSNSSQVTEKGPEITDVSVSPTKPNVQSLSYLGTVNLEFPGFTILRGTQETCGKVL